MIDFFKEMLSGGSKTSLMRFCTLLAVVVGLYIIVYQAHACDEVDWTGCCSLISIALAGKATQKALENKQSSEPAG